MQKQWSASLRLPVHGIKMSPHQTCSERVSVFQWQHHVTIDPDRFRYLRSLLATPSHSLLTHWLCLYTPGGRSMSPAAQARLFCTSLEPICMVFYTDRRQLMESLYSIFKTASNFTLKQEKTGWLKLSQTTNVREMGANKGLKCLNCYKFCFNSNFSILWKNKLQCL